jgi:iron(III) transport system permease protein
MAVEKPSEPWPRGILPGWGAVSRWDGWSLLVIGVMGLVMVPVLGVLLSLLSDQRETWQHLASTVLPTYLRNTAVLMVGVSLGVATLGTATAWVVSTAEFWGRRWLEWALVLPLAAPTYVLGYAYTDFLQVTGLAQVWLRQWTGWQLGEYWFPNIRSVWGVVLLLILTLYPYVYLSARLAFQEQSVVSLEVSRSLGQGPWGSFWRVALPMARPAIVGGTMLALMETLNDFGTVSYFGVDTLTTGIYRTWTAMNNRIAASQLAALLLVLVLGLLVLEQYSRRRARFYRQGGQQRIPRYELQGWRGWGARILCGLPVVLGFGIPAAILTYMTWRQVQTGLSSRFWDYARNSLTVSLMAAVLTATVAVVVLYGLRMQRLTWGRSVRSLEGAVRLASLGYALPGLVIAAGVVRPLGWLDNFIDGWSRQLFNHSTGLLLSGTIMALLFAYLVRFLAVAFATFESSLIRVPPNLDEAARSLGSGSLRTLFRIHLPLVWSGIMGAVLLVFVDVMKELPATLVLRPFNFDTLAARAYRVASDERLAEAGPPALAIVLVGILPVILLNRRLSTGPAKTTDPEKIESQDLDPTDAHPN